MGMWTKTGGPSSNGFFSTSRQLVPCLTPENVTWLCCQQWLARRLLRCFAFTFPDDEDKDDLNTVLELFNDYCTPQKNEVYERYVFRSHMQKQCESFGAFLTDLKTKAQTCNFGELKDSMIRDQVVFGLYDKRVKEKMLCDSNLTLDGAVKLCHTSELSAMHAKTFGQSNTAATGTSTLAMGTSTLGLENMSVDVVNKKDTGGRAEPRNIMPYDCRRCSNRHAARQCPAYGKTCAKCKGRNHFAKLFLGGKN